MLLSRHIIIFFAFLQCIYSGLYPIQIFAVCFGNHYVHFPMYFFSMAKVFQINSSAIGLSDINIPVNLTVLMDPMCYNGLSRCIPTLRKYFPFNILRTADLHNPNLESMSSFGKRFYGAIFKMDLLSISHFENMDFVMAIDLDCGFYHRFDDVWKAVTSKHESNHFPQSIEYSGLKKDKVFWAALEVSNHSTDMQFQYRNTTNIWYRNHNKTQFYPPSGLNTGVIIWNLALMRKLNMSVYDFIRNNTEEALLADQDYLNSWAYWHQDRIGLLSCKYNTRRDRNCIGPVADSMGSTRYIDLSSQPEECPIFHANAGFTRHGIGLNISLPFRTQFYEMCRYWTP